MNIYKTDAAGNNSVLLRNTAPLNHVDGFTGGWDFASFLTPGRNYFVGALSNTTGGIADSTTAVYEIDFGVVAASSTTSVTGSPTVYGQNATLTATVTSASGTPTGNVNFYDAGSLIGSGTLDGSGVATFSTSSLSVGDHSITASYAGDTDFDVSDSSAFTQSVSLAAPAMTMGVKPNISDPVEPSPAVVPADTTFVNFGYDISFPGYNGGGTISINRTDADGNNGVTVRTDEISNQGGAAGGGFDLTSALTPGRNYFVGVLSNTAGGVADSTTAVYEIDFGGVTASTTTNVSGSPTAYGQNATLTATVTSASGTPTGDVNFYDNGTLLGSGTLDGSGIATYSTFSLSVDSHSITASYAGDANFDASDSSAFTQYVAPGWTDTSVTGVIGTSTTYGQTATFTATVTSGGGTPTGNVNFYDSGFLQGSGTLDGSGVATFSTSGLSVGAHSITASYAGDSNFSVSDSAAYLQFVNQAATSTTLTGSPAVFGQLVTVSATVASTGGTPTGSVSFYQGGAFAGTGTLNGSGVATFTTSSSLPLGSYSFTASYGGDTNFIPSDSSAFTQIVAKASSTSTVTVTPGTLRVGQAVTISVVVAPNSPSLGVPDGLVKFRDGTTVLGTATLVNGTASLITSSLALGEHKLLNVVYAGTQQFHWSQSNQVVRTVIKALTTTTVTPSVASPVFGQPVTFTATVGANSPGAGTPTGSVTFKDGFTTLAIRPLVNGVATFTPSAFDLGSHSITAVYGGDSNYVVSTSIASTPTVMRATSTATVSVTPGTLRVGQAVTISVVVAPNSPSLGVPDGLVKFRDGTTVLGTATLVNGTASLITSSLSVGTHNLLNVVYAGTSKFLWSQSNQVVRKVIN